MESDLDDQVCQTLEDSERYMYGSAEVVGLMMARVLALPEESLAYARLLGRAFQYINFIRDVGEDLALGRCYLPQDDLASCGLAELSEDAARNEPERFADLIRTHLSRYRRWRSEASRGLKLIPPRNRIAIQTAADLYDWTADRIERDPLVVFSRKVKPSRWAVLRAGLRNWVQIGAESVMVAGVATWRRKRES